MITCQKMATDNENEMKEAKEKEEKKTHNNNHIEL